MAANVSANIMDFDIAGQRKRYIQIGTVMTAEEYRGRGLGRRLMETVLNEYRDTADGIYLFANDSACGFYERFGFVKSEEYACKRGIQQAKEETLFQRVERSEAQRERFLSYTRTAAKNNEVYMFNPGLTGFWTASLANIWYSDELDAYIAAEIEGDTLYLNGVFSPDEIDIDRIIDSFAGQARECMLGFTPLDRSGWKTERYVEEDCNFYILGEDLERFAADKLRMPVLSHA